MPRTRSSQRNPAPVDTTTAAGKLLAILDAFGPEQSDYSLAELSLGAGLPKSTTHRILAVLESWRGVDRTPTGRYRLGIKFFELGSLIPDRLRLREVALPYMEDLLAATHEVVHLAKLDGTDAVGIERLAGHGSMRMPANVRVGGRAPAACSSLGKTMLAYAAPKVVEQAIANGLPALTPYSITDPVVFRDVLGRIRREGVAYDREEGMLGLGCVGAPIFNHAGECVAAMSVSGPLSRINIEALVPAVRASTMGVSRRLGYRPPSRSR